MNVNVNCVSAKSVLLTHAEEVKDEIAWASSFCCFSACTGYVPGTEN